MKRNSKIEYQLFLNFSLCFNRRAVSIPSIAQSPNYRDRELTPQFQTDVRFPRSLCATSHTSAILVALPNSYI